MCIRRDFDDEDNYWDKFLEWKDKNNAELSVKFLELYPNDDFEDFCRERFEKRNENRND